MCPLHSKTVLLQLGEFRRWIHLQLSISISKMHLHLLIHLQNKQHSSQKHAVASGNKTCSLVENIQVVVIEKHMQTMSKNVHKLHDGKRPHPKDIPNSFALQIASCDVQMNFSINILLVQKLLEITPSCINMHLYQISTNSRCSPLILHHFQNPAQRNRQ